MAECTLSIGEAAGASGLNAKTIRFYEQIGLIPRARRGNRAARTGGNRLYDHADVERFRFIRNARLLGLGLDDIRELLVAAEGGCPGDQPLYHEKLSSHLAAIDERIEHLRALRAAVQQLMARRRESDRGGCARSGCGCMDAPALSSRMTVPAREPVENMESSGKAEGRNGRDGRNGRSVRLPQAG